MFSEIFENESSRNKTMGRGKDKKKKLRPQLTDSLRRACGIVGEKEEGKLMVYDQTMITIDPRLENGQLITDQVSLYD